MTYKIQNACAFLTPFHNIIIIIINYNDNVDYRLTSGMMPAAYRFTNSWYSINRMRIAPPKILDPNVKLNVSFNSLPTLDPSALYTKEDVQKMRDKILVDEKQDVVINNNIVAGQILGQDVDYQGYKIFGNLADHDVESIGTFMFGKLFYYLNKIGYITSVCIGLIMIYRMIKACYKIISNFSILSKHDIDLSLSDRIKLSISDRDTLLHIMRNPNLNQNF